MHTLILGAGFSGQFIAEKLAAVGTVCGSRRSAEGLAELAARGIPGCLVNESGDDALQEALAHTTHLIISVAPSRSLPLNDPLLQRIQALLASSESPPLPALQWIGYLSTIGVYGDHDGRWVDENTPCISTQARSVARREAELAWATLAQGLGVPLTILRLAGIYGPGRNAIKDALAGRARMLIKPDQRFNRIHVQDLAMACQLAAVKRFEGLLNITDDEPAPPQDVIRYAHARLGKPEPEAQDFATANISPMARSFYSENKQVSNERSKAALGLCYAYPTYREGLDAIHGLLADACATDAQH